MEKKNRTDADFEAAAESVRHVILNKRHLYKRKVTGQSKRILLLVNHEVVIYNFRLELVERLLADGYEVHISTPPGKRIRKLKESGAVIHEISFDRHGLNPGDELGIFIEYCRLIKRIQPVIVLGYTIKPNIYGAVAGRMCSVPFVANITGLGMAAGNGGMRQKASILLYRFAFGTKKGRIQRVFFQNKDNEEFFTKACIAIDKHGILPGSGVNLKRYKASPLPVCGDGKKGEPVKFAFISRIMAEKGIDQYLDAAKAVKKIYSATEFHVCGFFEPEYNRQHFDELNAARVIEFHGNIEDVGAFMSTVHCIVHPSYYPEGLSNVLLEAGASGRPVITTDRAGCREAVEGNGYLVEEKSSGALITAIKQFIELDHKSRQDMAKAGRKLVEEKFDRQIIVNAYMNEIYKAEE